MPSEEGVETVSTTNIIKESISMPFLKKKKDLIDVYFQFFYLRIDSIPAAQFSSWLRTLKCIRQSLHLHSSSCIASQRRYRDRKGGLLLKKRNRRRQSTVLKNDIC